MKRIHSFLTNTDDALAFKVSPSPTKYRSLTSRVYRVKRMERAVDHKHSRGRGSVTLAQQQGCFHPNSMPMKRFYPGCWNNLETLLKPVYAKTPIVLHALLICRDGHRH
jgi:hypothetical protein